MITRVSPLRSGLLLTAAALMLMAAVVNATVVVPHLRGDLVEISVRPTLLAATLLGLSFGTFAMFGFALLALVAAFQSVPRLLLAVVALTYASFGVAAFVWSHSPHTLGYALMGVLLGAAIAVPDRAVA